MERVLPFKTDSMFANRFLLSWPSDTLEFGGGGPSQQQIQEQKKQELLMQKQQQALLKQLSSVKVPSISIPNAPPPVAVPPPPTAQQADVIAAQVDQRRQAAQRYGFLRTTGPGSTGGYMSGGTPLGSSNTGGRPVLG